MSADAAVARLRKMLSLVQKGLQGITFNHRKMLGHTQNLSLLIIRLDIVSEEPSGHFNVLQALIFPRPFQNIQPYKISLRFFNGKKGIKCFFTFSIGKPL